jgi:beta-fructofuranosidase
MAMRDFFFRPENAWAADFIPFYANGRYRLFYLHDIRNHDVEGIPWHQVSTDDFVHFTEHGVMIPAGSKADQDFFVFTGCVMEADGRYHIFYTGHNGDFPNQGKPMQGVMHAVSDNLIDWKKVPEDTFFAPEDMYEPNDWRDPFVFWNPEAGEYWMLLAARFKTGPSRRRGCTALCTSTDLKKWTVRDPFWAPGLYYTHECPDLFKMGDWWYLVYSTFTERFVTHYRMSRSLAGPWTAPENDTFDGRAFYAAKTASDGQKRFVFGWNPTRDKDTDEGGWQWGGNLAVHEVIQEPDGTLSVRVPESVDRAFGRKVAAEGIGPGLGKCEIRGNQIKVNAAGTFGCCSMGSLPNRCKIQGKVKFSENTRGCGIMLKVSDDYETAYYVQLEPGRNRILFDRYTGLWGQGTGDVVRPVELSAGQEVELKVFVDETVCEVYINNQIAMSARMYNLKTGNWGVFVNEGTAQFEMEMFEQG